MSRCHRSPLFVPLSMFVLLAVLVSCTRTTLDPEPSPSPTAATTGPTSSPTDPDNSGTTEETEARLVWEAFHRERLAQLADDTDPDPVPFGDLATDSGIEDAIGFIRAGRGDIPVEVVDAEYWPQIAITRDRADITDCIIVADRAASRPDDEPTTRSVVWTGELVNTDGGWRVDAVLSGVTNCIPSELNDQLLAAYWAWHDAKNQWLDPLTPDHPLLDVVMTSDGLAETRAWLEDNADADYVIRDTHDPRLHAVVTQLGIGWAWVTDCYPADDGTVLAYDPDTGAVREDLTPGPTPGQLDRAVVNLERTDDGTWKVAGNRSGRNVNCEPGKSDHVVP